MPGSGRLILTGQLGDVMKESAQAALSAGQGARRAPGHRPGLFEKTDIHIHVPAGAMPKDGPSAGVAMFMALSLAAHRPHRAQRHRDDRRNFLRGLVLPIGGIKEKVLAAARAGITTVLLPARNRKDLEDVPDRRANKSVSFCLDRVDDAIAAALVPAGAPGGGWCPPAFMFECRVDAHGWCSGKRDLNYRRPCKDGDDDGQLEGNLSDVVLERARVREVTGVFYARGALEDAVDALLLSGFDRADIDTLGSLDELRQRLGDVYVAMEELPDIAHAPREPFIAREDITTTVIAVAGLLAAFFAMMAAFWALASDAGTGIVVTAAIVAGALAGGIGFVAVARLLGRARRLGPAQMEARGLVLWVRVQTQAQEDKASQIFEGITAVVRSGFTRSRSRSGRKTCRSPRCGRTRGSATNASGSPNANKSARRKFKN